MVIFQVGTGVEVVAGASTEAEEDSVVEVVGIEGLRSEEEEGETSEVEEVLTEAAEISVVVVAVVDLIEVVVEDSKGHLMAAGEDLLQKIRRKDSTTESLTVCFIFAMFFHRC